ncbi:MAG: folate-binding protein [Proteobacteria bacterium]|nr:folate-binding protein [Pseudomonadota bacterium]
MTEARYLVLDDRAAVRFSGEDARPFLQGLISNDVEKIAENRSIYAAFLTAQGKFLYDFFLSAFDNALYMDCEASRADEFIKRLTLYRLRSKVEIERLDDMSVVVAFGDDVLSALNLTGEAGAARPIAGGVIYTDPRIASIGARAIMPRSELSKFESTGISAGTFEEYEAHRLTLGLPDGSRDMVVEKAILLESGFDELHGVDWDKGCYLGQELTARTKYRGLVKKRLMPITIEGVTPAPGTQILLDGKDAGEVRSASEGRGIALIRLDAFETVNASGISLEAGSAKIKPHKPEWATF